MDQVPLNTLDFLIQANEIKLETILMRKCDYNKSSYVIVNTEKGWAFQKIAILVNELTNWKVGTKNGCRTRKRANGNKYFFFRFIYKDPPEKYIIYNIDTEITVKLSKCLVEDWDDVDCKVFYVQKKNYFIVPIKWIQCNTKKFTSFVLSKLRFNFCSSFVEMNIAKHSNNQLVNFHSFVHRTEGYLHLRLIKNNNTKKKKKT